MPEVPVGAFVDCADGTRRGSQIAFGINPISGFAVTAKTASYTVKTAELNCAFSNTGAAGAIVLTLPAPYAGATITVFKEVNQNVTLTCAAGTSINAGAGGGSLANTAAEAKTANVTLTGVSATEWRITALRGTWA